MRNKENEQVNLLKHGFQLSLTLNVVKWALRYIVNFQAVTKRKIFVSTSSTLIGGNLTAQSTGATVQENWRRNSYSKDVVVSSTFFSRPAARAPGRTCLQANGGTAVILQKSIYKNSEGWGEGASV